MWAFLIMCPIMLTEPIIFVSFLIGAVIGALFPDIDGGVSPYENKGEIMQFAGLIFKPAKLFITKAKDPQNLEENMQCAAEGGEVARVAREKLESKTGRAVVSPLSAKRFFAEQKPKNEIENQE